MKQHKKILITITVLILAILAGTVAWRFTRKKAETPQDSTNPVSKLIDIVTHPFGETASEPPTFDKTKYSLSDPVSLWVIVNKQRALPSNYTPGDLRQPNVPVRSSGSSEMLAREAAASALESLTAGAKQAGISLMLVSGYRSYGLQQAVYNGNVAREGQANADKTSARPGHSEHQTGLAIDVGNVDGTCQLDACFGSTPAGQWVAAHAHEYGFVIRYPEGKQAIVGYEYEPWHLRFAGTELANETKKSGQTLEEFFGLPAAPNY